MARLDLTPFRRLIDQVVPLAKPHFAAIFPSVAAPMALLGVLVVLSQRQAMAAMAADDPTEGFGLMLLFLTIVAASMGAFLVAYLVLTVAANDALAGRGVNMRRAWLRAMRPRALWTLLLVLMAGVLSLMLCVVPALLVWPLTALSLQVMVAEDRFGVAALQRSASLAWWNGDRPPLQSPFLRVAGLLFVGWVVQNAISTLAQGPFLAVQQYMVLRDAAGGGNPFVLGPLWIQLTGQILGTLATVASWFYWAFGYATLHAEILRGREAEDLRAAIQQLTGRDDVEAPPPSPGPAASPDPALP